MSKTPEKDVHRYRDGQIPLRSTRLQDTGPQGITRAVIDRTPIVYQGTTYDIGSSYSDRDGTVWFFEDTVSSEDGTPHVSSSADAYLNSLARVIKEWGPLTLHCAGRRATPASCAGLFTATAFLNVTTGSRGRTSRHFAYRPGHVLAQVMDPGLPGLPLTFVVEALNPRAAALEAHAIGRRLSADKYADCWPRRARRLTTGDVVSITPRTPTTGERRFWALVFGGHLTELEAVGGTLRVLAPVPGLS
ncbi:phiSA1p31-related protein [Kitasatospora sp. NPDC088160]|uniref:phiSA1p31-related protein n=1 Tax=Kitasatospora sp. NPDC088160 TaxID=3364072 RepID=UPI00381D60CD